jgi:hypothetical protein
MDELITWTGIGKLIFAGVTIYVIQPLLLVCRDAVLWLAIDRWLLDDKLHHSVHDFALAESDLAELPKSSESRWENGVLTNKLDGRIVSPQDIIDHATNWEAAAKRLDTSRAVIRSRRRRLEWLLRHYKQPDQTNPVDSLLKEAQEFRAAVNELKGGKVAPMSGGSQTCVVTTSRPQH